MTRPKDRTVHVTRPGQGSDTISVVVPASAPVVAIAVIYRDGTGHFHTVPPAPRPDAARAVDRFVDHFRRPQLPDGPPTGSVLS